MRFLAMIQGVMLIGMFAVGFFLAPQVYAQESDTCECYCAVEGVGATRVPDEEARVTLGDCQERCLDSGDPVATCAYSPDQKPQYNLLCFTQEECTQQGGVTTASGSGTPTQPGECKQGMYYCYPNPDSRTEATLQVAIGDLTVTGDLGTYVEAGYKWMLGAGTTIAIVFLMVAGVRWTLGGLSSEQVDKAKTTMRNAVIGLILLMSTYLILFTINPYLLKLQVPAFPMVKLVSTIGEGSCGYLKGVWGISPYLIKYGAPYDSPYAPGEDPGKPYTLANLTDETNCGSVAEIVADPDGNDVVDQTCTFDYCPESGERCFPFTGGGECLSCGELINGNPYVTPSSSTCASLSLRTTSSGSGYQQINRCFWTKDATFQPGLDNPVTGGTCALLTIDCSQIESCEDYDTEAQVSNNAATSDLESVNFAGDQAGCLGSCGDESLQTVCNDDPCGIAPEGKKCFSEGLIVEAGAITQLMSLISGNDCDTIDL